MNIGGGCFCHPDMAVTSDVMDIDAALNELGMLSSVSESRRQYLAECRRKELAALSRERKNSEPVIATNKFEETKGKADMNTSKTGYQVLQLNSDFVTHVSPSSIKLDPMISPVIEFGSKYNQENIEKESRSSRHSRSRLSSRMNRFKKPYDIPWLQRHSVDSCYPSSCYERYTSNQLLYSLPHSKSQCDSHDEVFSTEDSACIMKENVGKMEPGDKIQLKQSSNSDTSTGSKPKKHRQFCRSKSLDELDFSKLRVAETETMNYVEERKEIETVSSCLQNLHVNE